MLKINSFSSSSVAVVVTGKLHIETLSSTHILLLSFIRSVQGSFPRKRILGTPSSRRRGGGALGGREGCPLPTGAVPLQKNFAS